MGSLKLYLALGGAVLVGLLYFRGESFKAKRDIEKVQKEMALEANETLRGALARVQEEAARRDAIILELSSRQLAVTAQAENERAALDDLAQESADVEDYLSQPVPADLARLLFSGEDRDAGGAGGEPAPRDTAPKLRKIPAR